MKFFVVEVFFDTLVHRGKFPLFTCTCGIFGCGGYYVDVYYNDCTVMWLTEQSPFADKSIHSSNTFVFSRSNMINFAQELIQQLEELNHTMVSNGLNSQYELEPYKSIVKKFANL